MPLNSTNSLRLIVSGGGGVSDAGDLTGTTLASNVVNSSLKTINNSMTLSEKLVFLQSLGQYKRALFDVNTPASLTCAAGITVWESQSNNSGSVSVQKTLVMPPVSEYFVGQYLIISDAGLNLIDGGSFLITAGAEEALSVSIKIPGGYAIFTPGTDVNAGYWVPVGGSVEIQQQIIEGLTSDSTFLALSAKLAHQGDNNYITGIDWKRPVTINIGTSTFTWLDNNTTTTNFSNGNWVYISTSGGTIPTGMNKGIKYYIINVDNNAKTFQLSKTSGGSSLSLSGSQSGSFYVHKNLELGATTITGAGMNDGDFTGQILKLVDGTYGRSLTTTLDTSVNFAILNNAGSIKYTSYEGFQLWANNAAATANHSEITLRAFNGGGISFMPHNGGKVNINPIGKVTVDTVANTGAGLGGTIKVNTTTNSNLNAGVTDLTSYSVPANALGTNGDYIEFEAWGVFANNANAKQLIAKFGSTTLIDSTSLVLTNLSWKISGKIVRTGAATQTATTQLIISGILLGSVTTAIATTSSPAETLSGAITLKCTGQGVATADISQNGLIVKWMPAF